MMPAVTELARSHRTAARTKQEAIAIILGVPLEEIWPGTRFREDLGIDAYDLEELIEALERDFAVVIPIDESASVRTVGVLRLAKEEA